MSAPQEEAAQMENLDNDAIREREYLESRRQNWQAEALRQFNRAEAAEQRVAVLERWRAEETFRADDATEAWVEASRSNRTPKPRCLGEWDEAFGPVTWWCWQDGSWLGEPAWIGTPNDGDWPMYHTRWTPHPPRPAPPAI